MRETSSSLNVMVLGGGGREDALVWKLRQSPQLENIFVAPGNGGSEKHKDTRKVNINPKDPARVIEAVKDLNVGLVVAGPEEPLVNGLVDILNKEDILVFGPDKHAARLEGSKAEAVIFMQRYNIPHPESVIFDNFNAARSFLNKDSPLWLEKGIVVKASGLASGKGVFVVDTKEEAEEALWNLMVKETLGEAGTTVVIQEKLTGYEVSVMAIVDGNDYLLLPYSEDHKQVHDDDHGPNTGGMGVLAPHPLVDEVLADKIEKQIIHPTINGMRMGGIPFIGTLYPGVMVTPQGPKVLEYNVRFGDPETEAVMPLLDDKIDFYQILHDAAAGQLQIDTQKLGRHYSVRNGSCVVVTLAAGGYPGSYEKKRIIYGLDNILQTGEVIVFQAGTRKRDDGIYETSGGRVLMVTGLGDNVETAREKVYKIIGRNGIHFKNMHFRRDIGVRQRNDQIKKYG